MKIKPLQRFALPRKKILDTFDPVKKITLQGIYENTEEEGTFSLFDSLKRAIKNFLDSIPGKYDVSEPSEEIETQSIQKRIVPWESIAELELTGSSTKKRQPIIIVGTLLDNTPNIAGLTRTAEIFNVSQLVISNKKIEAEAQFQRISVSAEKHIPIIEVTQKNLIGYLLTMKEQGYAILGIEQTANSKSLANFEFPFKCLLLLGSEQEGIPASYLQHVDMCIEIPQLGTIRSLNAHVSASIVIWEYTKQQLHTEESHE